MFIRFHLKQLQDKWEVNRNAIQLSRLDFKPFTGSRTGLFKKRAKPLVDEPQEGEKEKRETGEDG